ncbi:MAG: TlpA family protein disulfide reductase [Candidatus Caldatribacteriaceae bacterium]
MKGKILAILVFSLGFIILSGCASTVPVPSPPCLSDMEEKNFTLPLLQGGSLTLSDYLGKPVLLSFFTPTCSHCIREAPLLEAAYQRYKDTHELVVIGVGYIGEGGEEYMQHFVRNAGITHPVVIDTSQTKIYALYGVSGVPHNFFFNRCGDIVQEAGELTESILEKYLRKIL